MAGNRGDDIVLAGSGGQRPSATLSALFDQTHRSTSLILAIDSLIIVLIAWDFGSLAQSYFGRAALLIWAVPLFVQPRYGSLIAHVERGHIGRLQ